MINFASTHWSRVAKAQDPAHPEFKSSWDYLCETYYQPVLAYVRHRVADDHKANDLTQEFFSHLWQKQVVLQFDRTRGKFRTFLLAVLKTFMADRFDEERAIKRGGGATIVPAELDQIASPSGPEREFMLSWRNQIVQQAMTSLRGRLAEEDKRVYYDCLLLAIDRVPYPEIARKLGLQPSDVKNYVFRSRKQLKEILKVLMAQAVGNDQDLEDEFTIFTQLG